MVFSRPGIDLSHIAEIDRYQSGRTANLQKSIETTLPGDAWLVHQATFGKWPESLQATTKQQDTLARYHLWPYNLGSLSRFSAHRGNSLVGSIDPK